VLNVDAHPASLVNLPRSQEDCSIFKDHGLTMDFAHDLKK